MSQTKTELYNLAAQKVGGRGRLVTTSQKSRFVDVFDLWYEPMTKLVQKAAHWQACRKFEVLPSYAERTDSTAAWTTADPAPGAAYAFVCPPDMLHPRQLSTGGHFDIGMMGDTQVLYAHEPAPVLDYTFHNTNTGQWENELFLAVAIAMAAMTCQTLTGQRGLVSQLVEETNNFITTARNNSANTGYTPVRKVAQRHAARGYVCNPGVVSYVYPYGPMLTVGQSANVK